MYVLSNQIDMKWIQFSMKKVNKIAKLIDGTYLRHKSLQIDFVLTTDIFSYDPIES